MKGVAYLKANAKGITFFAFLLVLFILSPMIFGANPGTYTATIDTPANGTNISGTYQLEASSDQNITNNSFVNLTFAFWNTTDLVWTNIATNITGINISPNGGNWTYQWDTSGINMGETRTNVTLQNSTDTIYSNTQNITIDNIAPHNLTYTSPTGNNTNTSSNTVEFNFTVWDNLDNVMRCALYINDSQNSSLIRVSNNSLTNTEGWTIGLPEGEWVWNITCNDSAGNTNTTAGNYTVIVDTTEPTGFMFIEPTPVNDTNQSLDNYFVNITLAEPLLDTCLIELTNSSGTINYTMSKENTTTCSFNVSRQTVSYFEYFRIWANDSAGNNWNVTDSSYTRHVTFDNVSPSNITYLGPANNTNTSSNTVEFNFTVWDDIFADGLSCNLYINDTINTTIVNVLNNTETNITLGLNNGEYFWNITCNDSANNVNTTAGNRTVTVNTISPAGFFFISPTPANNTNLTLDNYFVNVTLNYSFTMIDTVYLEFTNFSGSINYTMMKENETTYYFNHSNQTENYATYFYVYANDTANNLGASSVARHVFFDNTSPHLLDMIGPPTNFTNTTNTTFIKINLVVHDNIYETGLTCYLHLNGSEVNATVNATIVGVVNGTAVGIAASAVNDGDYYWFVRCSDGAGNNITSSEGYRTTVDTDAPDIQFATPTPADNVNLSQDNFFINVSYNETHPESCILELHNSTEGSRTLVNYTMAIDKSASICYGNMTGWGWISEGVLWNYTVYMNDTAGGLNSTATRSIGIGVGTQISIVAPTLATNTNTTYSWLYINISANFTIDDAKVEIYNYSSNAVINVTMTKAGTMDSAYVNITGLMDSPVTPTIPFNYTVFANSTSIAAFANSGPYNFRIDTTAPTMEILGNWTLHNDTATYAGNILEIRFNVTDNSSASCWVDVWNYNAATPTTVYGTFNNSADYSERTCVLNVTPSSLTVDGSYLIEPGATDNVDRNATKVHNFSGTRTGLKANTWNLITNLGESNSTLNTIGSLTTNITYASAHYNNNKTWATFRNGLTANRDYSVGTGHAVYIYANNDVTLLRTNYTSTTADSKNTTVYTGGWNLVGITSDTYVYNITTTWNNTNSTWEVAYGKTSVYDGNVTYASFHNATTDTYTSYRRGFLKNRYTLIPRGIGAWTLVNSNVTIEEGTAR